MQLKTIPHVLTLILDLLSFVRFCHPHLRLLLGAIYFCFEDTLYRSNRAYQHVLDRIQGDQPEFVPVYAATSVDWSPGGIVMHSTTDYLLCFYGIPGVYPGVIFTFQPVHVRESSVHQLLRALS